MASFTCGSVRIPASVNSIAGLRPTMYIYSNSGLTLISKTSYAEYLILLDEIIADEEANEMLSPQS